MNKFFTLILISFSFASFAQIKDNRIYFEVDEVARYQGGYNNFNKYISESINCKIKINKKEKNHVQLRFVVEVNGEIKHIEIISEKPFACSKEIAKALRKVNHWKPARKNNLPVRSIVQMDVNID